MAVKAGKARASRPAAAKGKAAAAPAPARTSSVTRAGASTLAPASTTDDVLDLQGTVGNQATVQLLALQRAPAAVDDEPGLFEQWATEQRHETQSLVDAVTADADPGFNLTTIVDDLRRAIDQYNVVGEERTVKGLLGGDTTAVVMLRQVKVPAVVTALDNRTPSQIDKIKQLYASQEGTGLEHDLFELSKEGFPSDLKPEEAQRIRALLRGTKPEPVKPDAPEATKDAAGRSAKDARAEADASEVQALLDGDLTTGSALERVMALHRKAGPDLEAMDAFYAKHTGKKLTDRLEDKLSAAQLDRVTKLRAGNWVGADAAAIEELRSAADKLALNPMGNMDGSNAKLKAVLVAGIDDVIDRNRTEAIAGAQETGQSASAAVEGRMGALMGTAGKDGGTLGSDLGESFGDIGKAMAARGAQTSMQAHAAELVRMEDDKSTSAEKVAAILRAIRSEATADLTTWAVDPTTSAADRAALQAHFGDATTELAKDYIKDFRDFYEGMRGDHRTYNAIVESASDEGSALLSGMVRGGGQATDLIQLEWAVSKKDAEQIKAVLARQGGAEAVAALQAAYDSEHKKPLRATLFGTTRDGNALPWEMARDDDFVDLPGISKGVLSGRDVTLVAQSLGKPRAQDMGGAKEVGWLASFGEAEVGTALINQGMTGAAREIGGDPETEAILKETNGNLQKMADLWVDEEDPLKRDRILQAMRLVRATLTGDAAAYEKDNAEVRASIRAVISIAAQIALAVVLPGAGGLIGTIAMQVGATVATNLMIYGKDYDLTMLRNDVLGGVAGGGGGALGKFIGKEVGLAAEAVASSISGDVAVAAVQGAKGAGIVSKLASEAGGFYLGAKATEAVTGADGLTAQGAEVAVVTGLIGHFRAPHVAGAPAPSEGATPSDGVPTHVGPKGDAYTEPGMTSGIPETIGHDATVPANADPYEPTEAVTPDLTEPTPAPEREAPIVDKGAQTNAAAETGAIGNPVEDRANKRAKAWAMVPQEVTWQTNDPMEAAQMQVDAQSQGTHLRVVDDPGRLRQGWKAVSGLDTDPPVAWTDAYGNTYVDGTRAPDVAADGVPSGPVLEEPSGFDPRPEEAEAPAGATGPATELLPGVAAGEDRGVERAITDPVEAARLVLAEDEAGRQVRHIAGDMIVKGGERYADYLWRTDYGGEGTAPPAWVDGQGRLVVNHDVVQLPFVADELPSGPLREDPPTPAVPEEVAALARGEGIPEIPAGEADRASLQATDQAMAVINDPQSTPEQRAVAMRVLVDRTVAEIRAFIKPYRMGREHVPVGEGSSIALTPEILKDACGMGRDLSADLLAARVGDSPTPITIDRMQAAHLGFSQNHAFAVVHDGANVVLVDATFGQFMDPEGTAGERNGDATANSIVGDPEGAAFAADLLRDGSVPLTQRNAELYLLSLGAPPERVQGMAARLLGGDGAVMHDTIQDGIVTHEAQAVGDFHDADVLPPREVDNPGGGSIPMVDRFLRDLVPPGDPLRPALEEASVMLRRVLDLTTVETVHD